MAAATNQKDLVDHYLTTVQEFVKKPPIKGKKYDEYKSETLFIKVHDNGQIEIVPTQESEFNEELATRVSDINSKNINVLCKNTGLPSIIEWYNQKEDVFGFCAEDESLIEFVDAKCVKHDKERKLVMYVWGKKHRDQLPCTVDHNFNAAALYGKRDGVDWRKDGRQEEIREAVRKCPNYDSFMLAMIQKIESKNCEIIGINCRAGRHRSVTCAIDLLEYYPLSTIHFLELQQQQKTKKKLCQ